MFDKGSSKVRGADKPKIEKFGTTLAQPELPAFPDHAEAERAAGRVMRTVTAGGRGVLVLLVVITAACSGSSQAADRASQTSQSGCRTGGQMSDGPVVGSDVLLQNVLVDGRGRQAGYRIYDDGRLERRPIGKPWVSGPTLVREQVERVRGAIRGSGVDRLEPRYEPTPAQRADAEGVVLHLHAEVDGAPRTVAVVRPCRVPAVDALIARVDAVLKEVW